MLQRFYAQLQRIAKNIPVIKNLPGFNSVPQNVGTGDLRYYKLSNLVLTLGMFVHLFWIFLFWYLDLNNMVLVNVISFVVYVFCIVINRKGYYFTASTLMVLEIIIHQIIAQKWVSASAGFQYYVVVIAIYPFLMPRGNWLLKSLLLAACVITFFYLDYTNLVRVDIPKINVDENLALRIMNIVFSLISLAVSGAYFTRAFAETENLLQEKSNELLKEKHKSDELLLNILPQEIASELKNNGFANTRKYESISIIFTDFKNFTSISETLTPEELVKEIDYYYKNFDTIVSRNGIEKIKTIGDAYMCAAGLPVEDVNHALKAVQCAKEILQFVEAEKQKRISLKQFYFEIRIGINSGSVVAGIVGTHKFAYDIWGDAVNIASRMESTGEVGAINISAETYHMVKEQFNCNHRGKINVKNKGEIDMYLVQ